MNQVSETLLLTIAQVSATLLGLLIVGAFFYIETGLRRVTTHVPEARSYLRATTKAIVALYGIALVVSFSLVLLDAAWASLVYALGSAYVIVVMAEWTAHSRSIRELVHVRRMSPWLAWPMFLVPLTLPWLLDGWLPDLGALTWGLLSILALAFINTAGLLMLAFDFTAYAEQVHSREIACDG
jgi:ABC-type anion transport system duplicated permease subunit